MVITTMATWGLSATTLGAAAFFEHLMPGVAAERLGWLLAAEGMGMPLGASLISSYATWARSRQTVSVTIHFGAASWSFPGPGILAGAHWRTGRGPVRRRGADHAGGMTRPWCPTRSGAGSKAPW